MLDELKTAKKFVGIKQSLKAINKGIVLEAYVAKDAEPGITGKLITLCEANNIEVFYCDTMNALGEACGIHIGAACAVTVK